MGRAEDAVKVVSYHDFLQVKAQLRNAGGFRVNWMPDFLFEFQQALTAWAIEMGRAAIFADCGLGKTPMQLVWAQNVVAQTNRPVLIATPLAVSYQTLREAEKFGIHAERCTDGKTPTSAQIIVTNYERVHLFDHSDFAGMVCDESSILKNFSGVRRKEVTEFMRLLPYRLLCTATAAPNDYIELGTSSEALGHLGHMDMLARFFKNDQNTSNPHIAFRRHGGLERMKWRFRGHAEQPFWKWVSSWARAVRRPSDLGFEDGNYILPELIETEHCVRSRTRRDGMLFDLPAVGLYEQREERRRTIQERCEQVAALVEKSDQALIWCHLNAEGDLLEQMISGAQQVSGSDCDAEKEEKLLAFQAGEIPFLVTKPKIGAWGLNLQQCAHVTFFPSHSYEQFYQGVRRCWRFGQKRNVRVDIVSTEGERGVLENLRRKSVQADRMFSSLVAHMNDVIHIDRDERFPLAPEVPKWL